MKKQITFLLAALMLLTKAAFGQGVVLSDADFINTQILAQWETDTTVSDFLLEAGKTYYVEGQFRPSHPINLMATGTGDMPVVRTWPNDQGEMPDQTFRPKADFSADGILFNALPTDTSSRAAIRYFRFSASGGAIVLNNCKVINCAQSAIRADASNRKIELTNSTFANMGSIRQNPPGNGRIIDGRAKAVDTIIMKNCVGVNIMDRTIRHYNSTSPFKHVDVQHNTFIHCGSYHGLIEMGTLSSSLIFKHNLIINPQSFGLDTTSVPGSATLNSRLNEREHQEIYPGSDSIYKMVWISARPPIGDTVSVEVHNNVYLNTTDIEAMFGDLGIENKEGMTSKDWISDSLALKMTTSRDDAFIRKTPDAVSFGNIPDGMTKLVYAWVDRGKVSSQGYDPDSTMDRRDQDYWMYDFDPSWTTSDPDFIGTDGLLVGAAGLGQITGIEDRYQENGSKVSVYPNPMMDHATIRFSLDVAAEVSLTLVNLIGQEVATLKTGTVSAGEHLVSLDKGDLIPGLYMAVFRADSYTEVVKISIK